MRKGGTPYAITHKIVSPPGTPRRYACGAKRSCLMAVAEPTCQKCAAFCKTQRRADI